MGDGLQLPHLASAFPAAAWVQANAVSKKVGGCPFWSVQQHSRGTALTVSRWIRPEDQN